MANMANMANKIKILLWLLAGLVWLAGLEVRGQQITLGTQTKGILPVNQGGTNATDAATARANIGAVGLADSQTLSNKVITSPRINDIRGYSNSLLTVLFGEAASAVNYVGIYQAATGQGPLIQALGTDANVDLRLRPQGAGVVDLGAMTAIKITGCGVGEYPRVASGNVLSCDAGTASGAPTTATYITQTPDATLTNEQALSLLSTGLLKNTAGVLSVAVAADLPTHASRHNDGGADEVGIDGSQVISGLVVDARIPTSLAGRTFTSGVTINDGGTGGQNFLKIGNYSSQIPSCAPGSSVLYSGAGQLEFCDGTTRIPVGNVFLAGSGAGSIPYITGSNTIQAFLPPALAGTANTIPYRGGIGDLRAQQFLSQPTTDSAAGVFQRFSSTQSNYILSIWREDTALMAGVDKDFRWIGGVVGNVTGSATTAGALTSNPADCAATGFSYQIDSAGNLTCRAVDLSTADTTGQLAVARLNVTGTPDSTKVLYGDRWAAPPAGGGSLGIYNVRDSPYNAAGDGVSDDTTEIAAAITACQDSARGGEIYFPPGIYGISAGLVHGNGSTSGANTASTKAVCRFVGAGAGDTVGYGSANVNASVIKWIGSNPGSLTYMVTADGPMLGWGMEHLKLDANSNSNVVGGDWRQLAFFTINDVVIANTGGGTSGGAFATKLWVQKAYDLYACFGTINNLRVRVADNSVGSAFWAGANSTIGTACSVNMTGGYLNRDNNYTSGTNTATYSLLLDSSDNFHSFGTHFSDTGGNGARNGCSIGASPSAASGAYPDSAHFYAISSGGMCGQTGTGRPFVVWGGECGANGQGSCDYHNAFAGGGTKPISLSGEAGKEFKGIGQLLTSYVSNDPDYADVVINHASGGQNGAGNVYFQRAGVNIARINTDYFTGMRLFTSDGTGSGVLYERLQLKNDGRLQINFIDRSTINTMAAEQWDMIGCSDCQRDTSCTAGGTGALAKAITNGTGIGNWVCN